MTYTRSLVLLASLAVLATSARAQATSDIYHDGWIDFNKNEQKDPYEDPSRPIDERVDDLLLGSEPPPPSTTIRLQITRDGNVAFSGETTLDQMRRTPAELVEWLYREAAFPQGCVLLTGTGIVPPDDFTLQSGDEIEIAIESVGQLTNPVE
jgi:Fumarylacetoacetate (FAA) hydrolase family